MFAVNSRARIIHSVLIVMFLFGAAAPTTALAESSVIQNDLANSSDEVNALQTSTVLLACDPGSYTFPDFGPVCSGASPGISLTEEFDVSGRIPYLGGGDVKFKIQCEGVDCAPQDIYYAASMDVTFSDPWGTPHDWDASLTNEIHFTTTMSEGENIKCGVNVASGQCHLEISGVIPAEMISENSDDWNNHYFTIHAYVSSPLSWVDYDIHTVVQVSLDPIVECSPNTFEPDNTPPTGSTLSLIAREYQRHTLCPQNDEDWAKFQATNSQPNLLVESFDLEPNDIDSNANTKITVEDASQNQIGVNLDRGLGPFPGSTDVVRSSRVVWHPATSGEFNIKVVPETPINEQEGSGYSLRLTNPFIDIDPIDQGSWTPTKVSVPLIWRSGNIIYFTQYFTYEQAELDALVNLNAILAWEFRRPTIDPDGVEQSGSVDYGDYWQSVNGVCVGGEYWTNLPNHSDKFVEESNSISGCHSNSQWSEELEIYIDDPTELVAGKAYYITVKFYIHDGYLNSTYQFYISKVEYCELTPIFNFAYLCNVGDEWKSTANLVEGYLQPAP